MDKKPLANRIPFESITQLDKWPLPRIGEDGKVVSSNSSSTSKAAKPAQESRMRDKERIEDVSEPVEHKPLTAEQLNQITEEAEQEGYKAGLEKGLVDGFEQGRSKGQELGRKQAYDKTKAALDVEKARWQSLCAALMEPIEQQDQAIENAIVDIAMGLAKHILGEELKTHPAALYRVVAQAVAAMPTGVKAVRVYLNPEDASASKELIAERGKAWEVSSDPQVARGGCRVESTESLVDFSVDKRLQEYLTTVREKAVNPEFVKPVVDQRPEAPEPALSAPGTAATNNSPVGSDALQSDAREESAPEHFAGQGQDVPMSAGTVPESTAPESITNESPVNESTVNESTAKETTAKETTADQRTADDQSQDEGPVYDQAGEKSRE